MSKHPCHRRPDQHIRSLPPQPPWSVERTTSLSLPVPITHAPDPLLPLDLPPLPLDLSLPHDLAPTRTLPTPTPIPQRPQGDEPKHSHQLIKICPQVFEEIVTLSSSLLSLPVTCNPQRCLFSVSFTLSPLVQLGRKKKNKTKAFLFISCSITKSFHIAKPLTSTQKS